ncbi:hypothetical protein Syun_014226 [Stephania yunnanensis]|uniref:Uncharacterized protein n=1 Tax=Stephania yunnanensis TaxID=152371 RepID=A0AAP0JK02_9MAGN
MARPETPERPARPDGETRVESKERDQLILDGTIERDLGIFGEGTRRSNETIDLGILDENDLGFFLFGSGGKRGGLDPSTRKSRVIPYVSLYAFRPSSELQGQCEFVGACSPPLLLRCERLDVVAYRDTYGMTEAKAVMSSLMGVVVVSHA